MNSTQQSTHPPTFRKLLLIINNLSKIQRNVIEEICEIAINKMKSINYNHLDYKVVRKL